MYRDQANAYAVAGIRHDPDLFCRRAARLATRPSQLPDRFSPFPSGRGVGGVGPHFLQPFLHAILPLARPVPRRLVHPQSSASIRFYLWRSSAPWPLRSRYPLDRPNILILYTDQQRWDALGANGNPDIKTPNLDRLASEGATFRRFFIQNPVCMPSRISFLTGQYPSSFRISHMGVPVPEDTLTLPRMLRPCGYTCGNIGKLHFLPHADRYHNEPHPDYGFDTLINADEPGCYDDAYRAWVRARAPEALDDISVGLPPAREKWESVLRPDTGIVHPVREKNGARTFPADESLTHTAFVADQTARFIEQNRSHPFLAIAGFYSPHSPWVGRSRPAGR